MQISYLRLISHHADISPEVNICLIRLISIAIFCRMQDSCYFCLLKNKQRL